MKSKVWKQLLAGFTGILLLGGTTAFADLNTGLVAYYPFDGNASDESGNEHNGILRGGVAPGIDRFGVPGGCYSFNGTDGYVEVPQSTAWAFGQGDFSLALWVKFRTLQYASLIGNLLGCTGWDFLWEGPVTSRYGFFLPDGCTYKWPILTAYPAVTDVWYHLAVTRSGNNYVFYVNGNVVSTGSSSVNVPGADTPLTIGQAADQSYFDGFMDDVRIYNRALSAAEVQQLTNAVPTLVCPAPATVECGTTSELTASVSDAEGDAMTVVWAVNGSAVRTNLVPAGLPNTVSNITLSGSFPLGTNTIDITVTDDKGAKAECSTLVTVVDTTPPVIGQVIACPNVLWPPNHRMVSVIVRASVSDGCGRATWKIIGVRSNEAVNGKGDGNTSSDWRITGDHKLQLRAERSGNGDGRIYEITVQAKDASGNLSEPKTVTVTVPKSMGKGR